MQIRPMGAEDVPLAERLSAEAFYDLGARLGSDGYLGLRGMGLPTAYVHNGALL